MDVLAVLLRVVFIGFLLLVFFTAVRGHLVVRMGAQGNQDGIRKGHEAEVGRLDIAVFLPSVLEAHGLDHGNEACALGNGGFRIIRGNEQGGDEGRVIPLHGPDEQVLEFVVRCSLDVFLAETLDMFQGGFNGGYGVLVGEAENFLLGLRGYFFRFLTDAVLKGKKCVVEASGSQGGLPLAFFLHQGHGGGRINVRVGLVRQQDVDHRQVAFGNDGVFIHKGRTFRGRSGDIPLDRLHAGKDAFQPELAYKGGSGGQ